MKPFELINLELQRQSELPNADDISRTEATSTRNDRIAIALAYLGRASEKVHRNEREGCDAKENLVKTAAVICEAIENE